MTNAEAVAHFASLPPNDDAEVLLINGDLGSAEPISIGHPGAHLDEVEEEFLRDGYEELATAYMKW